MMTRETLALVRHHQHYLLKDTFMRLLSEYIKTYLGCARLPHLPSTLVRIGISYFAHYFLGDKDLRNILAGLARRTKGCMLCLSQG